MLQNFCKIVQQLFWKPKKNSATVKKKKQKKKTVCENWLHTIPMQTLYMLKHV